MGEEVNYASVVFKNPQVSPPPEKKEEETVYDEVKIQNSATSITPVASDENPAKGSHVLRLVALCLGILCVLLATAVIALYIHMTEAISRAHDAKLVSDLRDNQTALLAANDNLTSLISNLTLANEIFQGDHKNLTSLVGNLSRAYDILQNDTHDLITQREHLKAAIFQFEYLPVSAYCPKQGNDQERVCRPCQGGWFHFQSSCYLSENPIYSGRKTWEEAQDTCRGKNSSLVEIGSREEQVFVYDNSYGANSEYNGFWIGLKKTDGRWAWTDGSDLTEGYWVSDSEPRSYDDCAVSVQQSSQTHLGWYSENCNSKRQWICEMKAVVLV